MGGGKHLTISCLFLFFMAFGALSFSQVINDPALVAVQNDLPSGSRLFSAYDTEIKNYFVLADGTKLAALSSLDLAYMQETKRDYRTYQFTDSSRNLSTLVTYPDIGKGFTPSETKYSKILYLPEETRYFGIQGNLVNTVTERNESLYSSPFTERDFEGVSPLVNTTDKYHFAIPGFEILIDLQDLTIFRVIETEEFGLTEIFEQYEMAPDSSVHLIQRISSSPQLTPMGECVYNVVEENVQRVEPTQSLKPNDSNIHAMHAQKEGFEIFPNPATQQVSIRINNYTNILEKGPVEVTLSALNGKLMVSNRFELESSIQLNTSSIPNGIYIVRISHGNYLQTEKLIIQK